MTRKIEGFSITFRYILNKSKGIKGTMFFEIANETETIVIEGSVSPRGMLYIPDHQFDNIVEFLHILEKGVPEVDNE